MTRCTCCDNCTASYDENIRCEFCHKYLDRGHFDLYKEEIYFYYCDECLHKRIVDH